MNDFLTDGIKEIFNDINSYIFKNEHADLNHVYIDGTKLEANANKYSWGWIKACITDRNRVFTYLTQLITEINSTDLQHFNVEIGTRQEYSVEYAQYILSEYAKLMKVDTEAFVHGSYNNYLYCEQKGMGKYMKFTMFKKETTDKEYHEN